ncbi:hypothetical protein JRC04_19095 [Mycolicibacterium sp. S2-37]|uniref:hypothetical protein n=1 Tax=Mycolicibacterium sp. S2-37 TaxID=2810297 RepID=UPI001A94858A|nr:hypothetical protein [Mycolicibacterium sp. S2-37]MBO0679575.1 hypothetical protein [Mycolicibacterium sp. S2-37]
MGGGLAGQPARQHPDLTRGLVLALLALDGVLVAIMGALFLPLRIGAIPFPLTAALVGAMNSALVWVALKWTDSGRLAALPLWTWLATVAVLTLGGPGGDIVFGGAGVMAYSALFYVVLGAGPPAWLLWRR